MADMQALKAELTTDPLSRGYAAMTDQQVADSLNSESVVVTIDVPASDIKRFFFVEDIWTSMKGATDPAANVIRDALVMFDSIRMTDPEVKAKVEQLVAGLVQAGHMTETQQAALLAMAETTIQTGAHFCYLTIYDAVNTDGIAWDSLILKVNEWPATV